MQITKEHLIKLFEEITAADIASTDTNLSVDQIFQQTELPSLGRQIFSVVPINGPNGGLFNVRRRAKYKPTAPGLFGWSGASGVSGYSGVINPGYSTTPVADYNDRFSFELVRSNVEIEDSVPIKTEISQEVIQDIRAMYGLGANMVIGKLLRGLANIQENEATNTFLSANAVDSGTITLSAPKNAETVAFEILQKCTDLIVNANTHGLKTYDAFITLPHRYAASFMGLNAYVSSGESDIDEKGMYLARVGNIKIYINYVNYDVDGDGFITGDNDVKVAYIGLKDHNDFSKSSAVFSPYRSTLTLAQDPNTAAQVYHIFNRFAITMSPLHDAVINPMLFKFTIAEAA